MRVLISTMLLSVMIACTTTSDCPPICSATIEDWQAAYETQDLDFDLDGNGNVGGTDREIGRRVCSR